ncbi:hypothetical protein HY642_02495 [Candidatus Woesearchaeota archaeon]|nr:hypothetical protein [Candidatus Woesearchaeota archaeon]
MPKRTFSALREHLVATLGDGRKTVNQLASDAGINWRTVDNHLIYLVGTGLVREVFSSPHVRIVELTEKGKEFVAALKQEGLEPGAGSQKTSHPARSAAKPIASGSKRRQP